ncbi:MAG: hypothetical protein H6865_01580 [Rhodospirillales bacterium]|nr:hypothetical protein [Alphaproteobacteria bacterium]MCB9986309.1 hypothetical protein [Rhodospirillales bacterium]USO07138.1 MAG: hypothetical protein H6866_06805 [Rhodospirillales bacterium]
MKFHSFKQYALTGALIVGLGLAPMAVVRAADNVNVSATVTILGALTATKVADMAFGTWYYAAGSTASTLVKDTAGTVTATPGTSATLTSVAANSTPAQVTVQIGGGSASENNTTVHMSVGALGAFTDNTHIALSSTTYKYGAASEASVTPGGAAVNVVISDGTAAEPVYLGATITLTGTAATGADTASFNVAFAY